MKICSAVLLFLFSTATVATAAIGQTETRRQRESKGASSTNFASKAPKSNFSANKTTLLPKASPKISPETYEHIHEFFLSEDYASALHLADQYLPSAPPGKKDEILYLQALSCLKLKRYEEARQKLRRLESATAAVSLGDSYYFETADEAAFKEYKNALQKYPAAEEAPYLLYRLLELADKLGKKEEAKPYRERLMKEFSETPQARQASETFSAAEIPSTDQSSLFSVQVGSFSKERNATALMRKLHYYKFDAYVHEHEDKMYRVRVGKLSSRQEALELEKRLKKDGYPTKIIP